MKYKMIVTDIDGTLVNDEHIIPEGNIKALKEASSKGMCVVLCSGRSKNSVMEITNELGLEQKHTYGAGYHGSVIFNSKTGEVIKNYKIEKTIIKKVLKLTKGFNFIFLIHDDGELYTFKENEYTKKYEERSGDVCTETTYEKLNDMISKFIVMGTPEELEKFEKLIPKSMEDECMHFYSSKYLYEFTNKEASKGNALKFLSNKLGIDKKETIGCGDNFNDMTLVEEAGLGVAVSNAVDGLKKVANYVTDRNNSQGAIEEVLNKFVLNK